MEFNYVDRYIKRKSKECRQSTLDQYKSTIVRFLSGIAEEKNIHNEMELYKTINNDTIEDFYEVYSDTHKKSCENNSISIIRQFFDYLVEDKGLYKSNPFGAIKGYKPHVIQQSVKEKDLLTKEEMIRFIDELSVPYPDEKCFEFNSKRNQFLFSLMATTGLRIEEALTLRLSDIEEKNGYVIAHIREENNKTHVSRNIPIANKCYECYREYMKLRTSMDADEPFVFLSYRGKKLTKGAVNKIINKYTTRLGLDKHITNHCFRHYANVQLKANSVPDYTVKYLLGWHDKSMSATYYDHYTSDYEKELCKCVNII